ncbi:MAG: transglycosylase domain-containing protein [Patescibacteria group bacterium]|jgi:1A family penicillin-binding protein
MNWWQIFKRRLNQLKRKRSGYRRRKKITPQKALLILGISGAILLLALFLTIIWFARDLPQPGQVVRREGFTTRVFDRNGEVIYDIFQEQKRSPITFEQLPENLIQATIAIEDKDFYHHKGFYLPGIFRGLYRTVFERNVQGGSTLTQQLVKNVLLTPQRTIVRKAKEFLLAIQIETRFSKDQILTMYLNEAPYGGTAWGVGTAAELYFGKSVDQLSLVESAILAGLPQRPTTYSPFGTEPEAYIARTKHVLRRMREDGYISVDEEEQALEELDQVVFSDTSSEFLAPHFVMYVKKQLIERYGEAMVEGGGLRVTTTLDLDLQELAEETVEEQMETMAQYKIGNTGVVVLDPQTGEILAMIGSKDYNEPNFGKFNTTTALRQPGSSIKPITYVTALKRGYTAAHVLFDCLTDFPGATAQKPYRPTNYDHTYHGPMQVRFALGNSKNVPAVKMLAQVGLKNMLQTAYDLGLSTLEPTSRNLSRLGLSVTLGGGEVRLLEMVGAYSAFANTGLKVEPVAILRVADRDGKILDEFEPRSGRRILKEGEAFIISDILADNKAREIVFGPNSSLNIANRKVAVKTGTTNDMRDNWAIGWTPQAIVGVWVGNNDNSPMSYVASGFAGASPIWRKIMLETIAKYPGEDFAVPDSVIKEEIDQVSGALAHDGFPSREEYFIKGTEPTGEDKMHVLLKVCREENKLATPLDIERGNYEEKEFIIAEEEDPYGSTNNRWQVGIDAWIGEQDDPRYRVPTEYCDGDSQVGVRIREPKDETTVDNEFKVRVRPLSVNDIDWVKIYVDGQEKQTLTKDPWEVRLVLSDGPYKIKAKMRDSAGKEAEAEVRIGVNVDWDWEPEPTATPTSMITEEIEPTPTLEPEDDETD